MITISFQFPVGLQFDAVQEEDLSLRCEALRIQLDCFQASEAVGTLALMVDGTCGEDGVVQYGSILKMLSFLRG